MWPGRRLAIRWISLAASLWVLIHSILFAASGEAFVFSSVSSLLVAFGTAAAAGFVDTRRKRELVLLRNTGVLVAAAPAFWVAAFASLESALAVALGIT